MKEAVDCQKENVREKAKEAYQNRLKHHYDEMKWLYHELYRCAEEAFQAFLDLLENMPFPVKKIYSCWMKKEWRTRNGISKMIVLELFFM